LNYGRAPRTPLKALVHEITREQDLQESIAEEFYQQMRDAQNKAKVCLKVHRQRQRAYADQKRRDVHYTVGQKVWLSTRNITLKMVGTPSSCPSL
jgi:hypothetical protein